MLKKLLSATGFQLLCLYALTQSAQIREEPLDISTNTYQYTATFFFPFSAGQVGPTITWTVQNGTIIQQNTNPNPGPVSAVIQWWSTPATVTITATDNKGLIQTATYSHGYNFYDCWITPVSQALYFGQTPVIITPKEICVGDPRSSNTYQWQEFSIDHWENMAGETNANLQLPVVNSGKTHMVRRMTTDGVDVVYSATSTKTLAAFTPGIIYTSNPNPALYNAASITATYAGGGLCNPNNLLYTWEQCIDFGVWTAIGNAAYAPNITIRGRTKIRRKVQFCDGTIYYSNVLEFNPTYTSLNYENLNYVRELTALKKGILSWEDADFLPIGDKLQSTTYLDGLGRSIQSVDKEVSPLPGYPFIWLDLVKHYEYDAAGRTIKDFIPYPSTEYPGKYKPNAASVQPSVSAFFDDETQSSPTYSKVDYDNSPLNRILKSMAPGASWAGSNVGVTVSYDFNNSNSVDEGVRIWTLDYNSSALPVSTQTYSTGTLLKTISTDENGKKVITYTDFSGMAILKKVQEQNSAPGLTNQHSGWVCTYYVYDDLGSLRYIMTPKAVEYLSSNNWPSVTQTLIDEFCFKYLYDEKGRTVVVKKPGVGEEKMIYDKKNRLVLSQHANQDKVNNTTLTKNQWSFVLYDDLNRTIATGLLNNDGDQTTLKGYIDNANYLLPSQTISAFVGSGNVSIIADYPVAGSSGSTNYLPGTDNNIVFNSIAHYDNYNYSGVKSFNNTYSFAYSPSPNNTIEATVKADRTNNLVTGEKIRVLDADNNLSNDIFLFSTAYYDETERPIQNLSDNIKGGLDYQTDQYDFSGKLMSSYTSHFNGSETHTVISKNEHDKIGRLTKLSKNFNNSFYKVLAEYTYDELGRAKTKRIDPGYTGIPGKTEMESLSYNYNIQGSVTGINKDYALSDNNYAQWDKFFGMYFTYPNHSTLPQWNGNISSITWKSQGDNTPRKFDFEYDNLDRFKNALYKQKNKPANTTWTNSEVDFSTYVEYEDGNGNIKSMKHMGIIPGVNNGIVVDDLRYSYLATGILNLSGNRLKQVDDLGSLGSNNGLLGDFKDVNITQDYYYDVNGNLVKDLNKTIKNGAANGVTYNYMDKPDKIIIEGKSTIYFTYDAVGEKLKKTVEYADGSKRINTYIADFVYEQFIPVGGGGQGDLLQFVLHEEGRLKIITPVSNTNVELNAGTGGITNWPGGKQGVFEYFIKDHLGNTRLVLTEEIQKEFYRATVESTPPSLAIDEEKLFGQVNSTTGEPDNNNELRKTRYDNTNPSTSPWPNKSDDYTRLTAAELQKDIGPNLILKVMAGDIISSNVDYYYVANNPNGPSGYDPVSGLVNSLVGALMSNKANALSKNQQSSINASLTGNVPLQDFLNEHNTGSGAPKAFLNIVFFDEQFKFIARDLVTPDIGSGFVQVNSANNSGANMVLQKKAPKNGWVFIYLSNESNEIVYFDNFYTAIEHGRISEENHFYPFGLKIGAISSRAFNKLDTKYEYQGDYSEVEEETGWSEFDLRMYDPQIGRWTSPDPYDEFASPYVGMGDNPINETDPDGGRLNFFESNGTLIGAGIGLGIGIYLALKNDNPAYAFAGLAIGAGAGYLADIGSRSLGWFQGVGDLGWNYGGLNFTLINATNQNFAQRIIDNLKLVTGLVLQLNPANNQLGYATRINIFGKPVPLRANHRPHSGRAFKMVKQMINSTTLVNVDDQRVFNAFGTAIGPHVPVLGANLINMDNIWSTNYLGSVTAWGVNFETFSDAMVFIHEYGHTGAGGSFGDQPRNLTNAGRNEIARKLNKIRRQMSRTTGRSWGKRMSYTAVTDPTGTIWALALNRAARKWMRRFGTIPPFTKKYKFVQWIP